MSASAAIQKLYPDELRNKRVRLTHNNRQEVGTIAHVNGPQCEPLLGIYVQKGINRELRLRLGSEVTLVPDSE